MSWHTDQWNALGTWVSGAATLAAVGGSLWLASESRRVRLRVRVGINLLRPNDGSAQIDLVNFGVTNLADRPATITEVGWVIGRRGARRFAGQDIWNGVAGLQHNVTSHLMHNLPMRLDHGQQGNFATELTRGPWLAHIVEFVGDSPITTLRGIVTTSTGAEVLARPAPDLIARIQTVRDASAKSRAASVA